jgi:hypothetical protein
MHYVTWFAAGLRMIDISDPPHPVEKGYFIPQATTGKATPWTNDVAKDDRGIIFVTDKVSGLDVIPHTTAVRQLCLVPSTYSITWSARPSKGERKFKGKRVCSFEIENQLDFHRLHHRQLGWLRSPPHTNQHAFLFMRSIWEVVSFPLEFICL